MKTEKFEEFVMSICKPCGVEPTSKDWSIMRQMRQLHIPFAIVIGRKDKSIDIRQYPINPLLHTYACLLYGQMRRGNVVLLVHYKISEYLRLLSIDTWTEDYRAIVPEHLRSYNVLRGSYRRKKPCKASVLTPMERPKRDAEKYVSSDEDVTFGNNYKKRYPNRGFSRTHHANEVMNRLGALAVYA